MRVVETYQVPLATARGAVIEVQVLEKGPPRRWRSRLALWLIRIAGRLTRMRVRVIRDVADLKLGP